MVHVTRKGNIYKTVIMYYSHLGVFSALLPISTLLEGTEAKLRNGLALNVPFFLVESSGFRVGSQGFDSHLKTGYAAKKT